MHKGTVIRCRCGREYRHPLVNVDLLNDERRRVAVLTVLVYLLVRECT